MCAQVVKQWRPSSTDAESRRRAARYRAERGRERRTHGPRASDPPDALGVKPRKRPGDSRVRTRQLTSQASEEEHSCVSGSGLGAPNGSRLLAWWRRAGRWPRHVSIATRRPGRRIRDDEGRAAQAADLRVRRQLPRRHRQRLLRRVPVRARHLARAWASRAGRTTPSRLPRTAPPASCTPATAGCLAGDAPRRRAPSLSRSGARRVTARRGRAADTSRCRGSRRPRPGTPRSPSTGPASVEVRTTLVIALPAFAGK